MAVNDDSFIRIANVCIHARTEENDDPHISQKLKKKYKKTEDVM